MAIKEMSGATSIFSPYVTATVQSSNFTSDAFNIQQFSNFAIQLTTTNQSSLNVSIDVQASVDGSTYVTIPGSTVALTTNTSYIWNFSGAGYVTVRLSMTFSAGSANFAAKAFAKLQ